MLRKRLNIGRGIFRTYSAKKKKASAKLFKVNRVLLILGVSERNPSGMKLISKQGRANFD